MMLLSESNLPLNQTDKTPNSSSVEVPGRSLVKVKYGENFAGMNKENILVENSALAPEPRSKSAVRVRLEDRFNSIQTENPRCQEPQESGVTLNNLVTLIRQPSELISVPLHQQENKCAALGKNKTAPAPPSLQFTYPLFTMNACSTAASANPSQAQTSGTSCTVLEAAKHQDLGIPKTLPFCYQEIESTKQTVDAMNKALPEEVWIKVGGKPFIFFLLSRHDLNGFSEKIEARWIFKQPTVPQGFRRTHIAMVGNKASKIIPHKESNKKNFP
uniref:Uncharacterized protein n=1 Tax=Accipiter nisus TaxID=211598 RepID=A0A8B9MV75_9AVES